MSGLTALIVIIGYFSLLFFISKLSAKNADASTFFIANRNAPWPLVAYGMIGVSISGITFISVPGQVLTSQFSYFQMVIGYAIGLLIVAYALLPAFYKINAISIYSYLGERFGSYAHKTGSYFFLFAQVSMASIKLYLMAHVVQLLILDAMGLPFWLSVGTTLILIFLYTYKGGIKTVILTDTLQTTFLILAMLITIWIISDDLGLSLIDMNYELGTREISKTFFWSWEDPGNFWKMVLTGIILTVMNNGLDQSIMQKHLTCKNISSSQKNILTLALVLIAVNFLFLFLGGALNLYVDVNGIPVPGQTDDLYPILAMNHFGQLGGILFILGIAAAAYSSADSSLTGLTTSFCIDILKMDDKNTNNDRKRIAVHLGFTMIIFILILLIDAFNNESILNVFIKTSGFVYGPLMGLFGFGLLTKRKINDKWVAPICILSPIAALLLNFNSESLLNGYEFGYEILVINSLIAFLSLYAVSLLTPNKRPL